MDQDGLESTVRGLADYWVQNINKTTDSQYVTLAREIVVYSHAQLQQQAREVLLRKVISAFSDFDKKFLMFMF